MKKVFLFALLTVGFIMGGILAAQAVPIRVPNQAVISPNQLTLTPVSAGTLGGSFSVNITQDPDSFTCVSLPKTISLGGGAIPLSNGGPHCKWGNFSVTASIAAPLNNVSSGTYDVAVGFTNGSQAISITVPKIRYSGVGSYTVAKYGTYYNDSDVGCSFSYDDDNSIQGLCALTPIRNSENEVWLVGNVSLQAGDYVGSSASFSPGNGTISSVKPVSVFYLTATKERKKTTLTQVSITPSPLAVNCSSVFSVSSGTCQTNYGALSSVSVYRAQVDTSNPTLSINPSSQTKSYELSQLPVSDSFYINLATRDLSCGSVTVTPSVSGIFSKFITNLRVSGSGCTRTISYTLYSSYTASEIIKPNSPRAKEYEEIGTKVNAPITRKTTYSLAYEFIDARGGSVSMPISISAVWGNLKQSAQATIEVKKPQGKITIDPVDSITIDINNKTVTRNIVVTAENTTLAFYKSESSQNIESFVGDGKFNINNLNNPTVSGNKKIYKGTLQVALNDNAQLPTTNDISGTIQLLASDSTGNVSGNTNVPVVIKANNAPTCSLDMTYGGELIAPKSIFFSGHASGGSGKYTSYSFDSGIPGLKPTIGSGGFFYGIYTYNTAGTYTPTLAVTDYNGKTGSCSVKIEIKPSVEKLACVLGMTYGGDPIAPKEVFFSASATGGTGQYKKYTFTSGIAGDAAIDLGTKNYTTYTYNSAGSYIPAITVTDSSGNTASCSGNLTLKAPPKEGTITISPESDSISITKSNFNTTVTKQFSIETTGGATPAVAPYIVSGLPNGITATRTLKLESNKYTSGFTFVISPSVPVGTYTATIRGAGILPGEAFPRFKEATLTITITQLPSGEVSISPSSDSISIAKPTSATNITKTFTVRATGNYNVDNSPVSVSGLPSGVIANVSSFAHTPQESATVLTFTISPSVAPGTYTAQVQGKGIASGLPTKISTATLTITITQLPSEFSCSLSASPSSGDKVPLGVSFTLSGSGGVLPYRFSSFYSADAGATWENRSSYLGQDLYSFAHTYNAFGTYYPFATLTDSNGTIKICSTNVNVVAPASDLSALINASPLSGEGPLKVNVSIFASGGNQGLTGSAKTYKYFVDADVGEPILTPATTNSSYNAGTFTYPKVTATTTYTIIGRVTDALGAVKSDSVLITVYPSKETAQPDLCANVTCDNACDGTTLLTGGTCNPSTGTCSYAFSDPFSTSCGYVPISCTISSSKLIGLVPFKPTLNVSVSGGTGSYTSTIYPTGAATPSYSGTSYAPIFKTAGTYRSYARVSDKINTSDTATCTLPVPITVYGSTGGETNP